MAIVKYVACGVTEIGDLFYAVPGVLGSPGVIVSSYDGVDWFETWNPTIYASNGGSPSGNDQRLSVATNGSMWVTVGGEGWLASADGLDWYSVNAEGTIRGVPSEMNQPENLDNVVTDLDGARKVTYGHDLWVACGYGGAGLYSSELGDRDWRDAVTEFGGNVDGATNSDLLDVGFNDDYWYLVSVNPIGGGLYEGNVFRTSDLTADIGWEVVYTVAGQGVDRPPFKSLTVRGDRIYVGGLDNRLFYSGEAGEEGSWSEITGDNDSFEENPYTVGGGSAQFTEYVGAFHDWQYSPSLGLWVGANGHLLPNSDYFSPPNDSFPTSGAELDSNYAELVSGSYGGRRDMRGLIWDSCGSGFIAVGGVEEES